MDKHIYPLDNCERNYYYTEASNLKIKKSSKIPGIIFDNGSFNGRAGWSIANNKPSLVFPNLVRKPKRNQVDGNKDFLIGNEIPYFTDFNKYLIKSPFYNDIVLDFETQENVMDYVFKNLNVKSSSCVNYPLLMTETFGNLASARKFMTELLFEKYGIPSLCYGVDSLFAFNAICNNECQSLPSNALILSLSHSCIHFIARVDDVIQYERAKRLDIGGRTIHRYLSDLISLACPTESYQMFPNRIYDVTHEFVQLTSIEYFETLDKVFKDSNANIYLQLPKPLSVDVSNENANKQDQQQTTNNEDNKKKNVNFYKQIHSHHNANRVIKIQSLKNEIATLEETIQDDDDTDSTLRASVMAKLKKYNMQLEEIEQKYEQSENFLNDVITLDELLAMNTNKGLSPEEVTQLQLERLELIEKRNNRLKRKKELTKRKGSAMRERMRKLNKLDDFEYAENKKTNDTKSSKKQVFEEDLFGMNDDDWDVYRLNANQDSDHDSEEENERINQIENKLAKAKQPIEQSNGKLNKDIESMYQIRLSTEPYRAAELLFRPYIAGLNKYNGLSDCIEMFLKQFTTEEQHQICKHIYVTGGVTNIKNFHSRLCSEFQSLRPFQSETNIVTTYNSMTDSWDGAQQWFNSCPDDIIKNYFTDGKRYAEYGSDCAKLYKMHPFSNLYNY